VLTTYALETDAETLALLEELGYQRPEPYKWYAFHLRELDGELPEPAVPEGFRLHTVQGGDDFRKRVEIHRAVWAPSRVTEEVYRRVTKAWPYRADLDCVVEAPDGRLASYCLAWLDEANRAGELEPVGTAPEYRRRGLGTAACLSALHRLRDKGAKTCVVYADSRESNPGPRALYESIGFKAADRAFRFERA
jgi:ribosomal protein S18 acetylase RimI-like enzyme